MSDDGELPDEVEPAEGWEFAGRELLEVEAERIEQRTQDLTRELRSLSDPSFDVPRGTASEIRIIIRRLERLAEIADELDPAVADPEEVDADLSNGEIAADD